jgi:hypothetical protein
LLVVGSNVTYFPEGVLWMHRFEHHDQLLLALYGALPPEHGVHLLLCIHGRLLIDQDAWCVRAHSHLHEPS